MKNELGNIFATKEPARQIATVVMRLSRSKFRVVDRSGRTITVLSATDYPPGTEVLLENGRIAGPALAPTTRRYEV